MRYLKLFEAFESETISKVMKFVNSKIGRNDKARFRRSLIDVLKSFNIPIDKIKESNVSYLNKSKALKIKNDSDVSNDFEVYCLKFWFSIEDGYIGYTGVGNTKINYHNWKNRRNDKRGENKKFDADSLDYIKDRLGITKGEIKPLKPEDYANIKTGDKLIGMFTEYDDLGKLGMATAWVDSPYIYAIQDVSNGSSPDTSVQTINGVDTNWRDLGRFCWSLGSLSSIGDDHRFLHTYKESDKTLHYPSVKFEEDDDKTSLLDFNLPLYRYEIVDWSSGSSIDSPEVLDNADFAVVFYIDNMLDPDKSEFYEKPSDIKLKRNDDRKGATKLLSDNQIKNINIDRYMSKLVSKMGIKEDISELKNLQKIVSKMLCKEFALISLLSDRPRISNIITFSNRIKNLISGSDSEYHLENVISAFKSINIESSDFYKKFSASKKVISRKEYNTEIFNKIYEIGNHISEYFNSIEINTLEDLKMVVFKMRSISALYDDEDFRLNDRLSRIIRDFYDSSDVDYYAARDPKLDEEEVKSSLKKLEGVERYIKSILN
jgi:hypothetical protein